MTRISKVVLLGAMVGGLMIGSLGGALADEHEVAGGPNGASLEYPFPTLGTPTLTVTVNGTPTTIGGQQLLGGTLRINTSGGDWHVYEAHADAACQPGEVGKSITFDAKSPQAVLEAVYIEANGNRNGIVPQTVASKNPRWDFSICV